MKSAERLKILGLKGISAIVTAAMIAALAAEPISGGISAKAANTDEPLKISEWGSLSIGGTGYVTGIVTGQEVMYARTDVGGAYRYDNGRWTQIMSFVSADEVGMMSVESIAVDPTDDNTVYMLCGCQYFNSGRTWMLKSTDGGNSFTKTEITDLIRVHGNGNGRQTGERIAVDPNNPLVVYAAGRTGGIIKSTDGGATWSVLTDLGVMTNEVAWFDWYPYPEVKTTDNLVGIISLLIDENSGMTNGVSGKIYAAASVNGKANIFISENGGETWEALSSALPTNFYPQRMRFDNAGNLIITYSASAGGNDESGAMYRYNVGSGTVDDISLPNSYPVGDVIFKSDDNNSMVACTRGKYLYQQWIDGTASWGDTFFRTYDGGRTWNEINMTSENPLTSAGSTWVSGIGLHWAGCMETNPLDNDQMFVISGNGIYRSDNIWDELPDYYFDSNGIEESVPFDVISIPDGNVYSVIGDYNGFIHTSVEDYAMSYSSNRDGNGTSIGFNPFNTNVIVKANNKTSIVYSLDAGLTWSQLSNSSGDNDWSVAVTSNSGGSNRYFRSSSSQTPQYTDNNGATWNSCSGIEAGVVFEVDSVNKNVVYASKSGKFYYSTDYGKTFSVNAIPTANGKTAHAYGTAGKVYIAYSDSLRVTEDGGKTFSKVSGISNALSVGVGKSESEGGPLTIYVSGYANGSGERCVYYSTDDGNTWLRLDDDNHLYGGTCGRFIVGDMNEFGTVYMSTEGMGIVYHRFIGADSENKVKTYNNTYSGIKYSGSWEYAGNRSYGEYKNDVMFTTAIGDSFEFIFNGVGIDYIAPKGGSSGEYADLDIYIDGVLVSQFVNTPSSNVIQQQPIFSTRSLSNTTHTLKVIKTGGGNYFQVDALKVYPIGSFEQSFVEFNTEENTGGAQIRLKTDGTANEDLRFKFSYDLSKLPASAEDVKLGFIYASGQRFSITGIDTSALDVSQFTLEAVSQPDADVYYYEAVNIREEGNIKFSNIVLTDILDNELNYYYLARPCVTYTISGVQYCEYGNIVSRSVFYVAKVCYDNNLVGEADKSYLLERILNKVDAENYPLPEPDNDYIRPE